MTLEITWHNIEPSPAIEADVRKRFEKLTRVCTTVTGARIAIDQPHHSQHHPRKYGVTLDVHVPGTTIVADHSGSGDIEGDLYQLIHHSFDAARRQVQDYTRIRQGKVKQHSKPAAPPVIEDVDSQD